MNITTDNKEAIAKAVWYIDELIKTKSVTITAFNSEEFSYPQTDTLFLTIKVLRSRYPKLRKAWRVSYLQSRIFSARQLIVY